MAVFLLVLFGLSVLAEVVLADEGLVGPLASVVLKPEAA